jgi:predicted small secreted protein
MQASHGMYIVISCKRFSTLRAALARVCSQPYRYPRARRRLCAPPNRRARRAALLSNRFQATGNGQRTENPMKALIATIVAASFLVMGGCNTMEGAGKDVKAGGEKVEKEAVEHKRY